MRYTFGSVEDLLIERGRLTPQKLDEVRARQRESQEPLPEVLESLGVLTRADLYEIVGERMGVPYTPLTPDMVRPDAVALLDEDLARKYKVMPVMLLAEKLTVGMTDPQDLFVLDQVKGACGHTVNPVLCTEADIETCIEHFFGKGLQLEAEPADEKEARLRFADGNAAAQGPDGSLELGTEALVRPGFSIRKIVDLMISEAYNMRASDIHIEGARDHARIRYRVDGELREVHRWPKATQAPVVSRLKILSNLDITRSQIPQDGHFSLEMKDMEVDFRVATTPTERGENCVIRILDQSKGTIQLKETGLHEEDLARVGRSLRFNQGFVLVTGPTGSGKTTTLYAMLNEINSVEKKIITIEDPVEYRLELINQIPVNPRVGLTFATGLRSVLRQDPDVVLVGEIRDQETAHIAVQASLTGHLLLSTLHTNGTIDTIFRLIDIGIEPYFVKEVINCVVAQRLVKMLCPYCREMHEPDPAVLGDLGISQEDAEAHTFHRPAGCYFCARQGFRGRTAVMEVLMGSDAIKAGIMDRLSTAELREIALKDGMRTFLQNALDKVYEGVTTLEEIRRVVPPHHVKSGGG